MRKSGVRFLLTLSKNELPITINGWNLNKFSPIVVSILFRFHKVPYCSRKLLFLFCKNTALTLFTLSNATGSLR